MNQIDGAGSFDWAYFLEEFTIDPANQYFSVVDGILYDKNIKRLMTFPAAKNISV